MTEVNGTAMPQIDSAFVEQTRLGESEQIGFPVSSSALVAFGFKFKAGGAHISRTLMLQELMSVLDLVPYGTASSIYRKAILEQNILAKATDSTRHKSLRHLRELYGLDESIPVSMHSGSCTHGMQQVCRCLQFSLHGLETPFFVQQHGRCLKLFTADESRQDRWQMRWR